MLRTLLASLLIVAAGVATLATATDDFRAFTSETARRIDVREHPRKVPGRIPLQSAQGTNIDFAGLRGRWLLVDFIYTRCMTYCSVQGTVFARGQRRLAQPIAAGKLTLLSISFDPRDGPPELAAYLRRSGDHGMGWVAARPQDARGLDVLLRAFGVKAVPDQLGGYVHNAAINVVDPDGRLVAILDWDDLRGAERYLDSRLRP